MPAEKDSPEASNPVPRRFARVIDADAVEEMSKIGPDQRERVFVTAAEDIAGLTAGKLSSRLGIPPAERYWVVEFPAAAIEGPVTSPVREAAQCFTGGGRTRGGAREFHVPNQPIPAESTRRIVT